MLWKKLLGTSSLAPAPTGIQFVGSKAAFAASNVITTSLTDLTGGVGNSPVEGDVVVAYVGCSSTFGVTFSFQSASYALVTQVNADDSVDAYLRVARRRMTSTPDSLITASHNGATASTIALYVSVWRGVSAVTPLDVTASSATGINTLIANPPSITPVTAGAYIVSGAIGANTSNGVQATGVYTSGDLTNFQSAGGGSGARTSVVGGGYKEWESGAFGPSAFGTANITNSTSCSWASVTLALRPA